MNRWKESLVKYNASIGFGTQSAWYMYGHKHFIGYMLWDMYKWYILISFFVFTKILMKIHCFISYLIFSKPSFVSVFILKRSTSKFKFITLHILFVCYSDASV